MRASRRAGRSGVAAYGASASNAGGHVANISTRPGELAVALLHWHKGFKLVESKVAICKGFMQWDFFGCAGARVLREFNCESLEHIIGSTGFKAC